VTRKTLVEYREIEVHSTEYEESLDLRWRVMYKPFGLAEWLTPGVLHERAIHIAGVTDGRVVAYGRLSLDPGGSCGQLYQVVVDPDVQGKGVGRGIMMALECRAALEGMSSLRLDARLPAVGFYNQLGWLATAPEYITRTGLPHVPMAKDVGTRSSGDAPMG